MDPHGLQGALDESLDWRGGSARSVLEGKDPEPLSGWEIIEAAIENKRELTTDQSEAVTLGVQETADALWSSLIDRAKSEVVIRDRPLVIKLLTRLLDDT